MRKVLAVSAVAVISTFIAMAVVGVISIATATPRGPGTAAVAKALARLERKQNGLSRELTYIRSEAKTNRNELGSKLGTLERSVTNIGYETGRILRCVQHLGGSVGSCAP
jgi:hypothetical protein